MLTFAYSDKLLICVSAIIQSLKTSQLAELTLIIDNGYQLRDIIIFYFESRFSASRAYFNIDFAYKGKI